LEKAMKNLNASQKRKQTKKEKILKLNMKIGKLKMNIFKLSKLGNSRMNNGGNIIPAHLFVIILYSAKYQHIV
jgi:hypothetical protein